MLKLSQLIILNKNYVKLEISQVRLTPFNLGVSVYIFDCFIF